MDRVIINFEIGDFENLEFISLISLQLLMRKVKFKRESFFGKGYIINQWEIGLEVRNCDFGFFIFVKVFLGFMNLYQYIF